MPKHAIASFMCHLANTNDEQFRFLSNYFCLCY